MHDLLRAKMISLRANLLAAYSDSAGYPAPVAGREREIFLHSLLEKVLPPNHRVGAGVITDCHSNTTGQIDLVVELPLSLSLPIVGENRLYFADTVGAAIEVKSNLSSQWSEAHGKLLEVNALSTKRMEDDGEIKLLAEYQVPFFIVSFKGPKTMKTLESKLAPRRVYPPAGIYVIESNLFVGYHHGGWVYSETEPGSLLAFITSLYTALNFRQHQPVALNSYI
jgi:hypothetical protein